MNVLLFTVDDMNADTPGSFGGPGDVTPNIDRLAREGMAFGRAHVTIAVCQPSRSVMHTGLYPHRNGAEGFGPIDDDVPLLTELLRGAGYRCGILGKVDHLQPVQRFGWDLALDRDDLGMGRDPARYAEATSGFLRWCAGQDAPWFLMANAHDPHRPFSGSDDEQRHFDEARRAQYPAPSRIFEPGAWPVPGFLPDLAAVRRETAQYLSSCRRADDVLGAVLGALAESGQADETLVVFLSDNGMAFPFAKSNCYLHSTRTPLIVRWPGHVEPGRVDTSHYVSGVDLLPAICDAVGVAAPDRLDGRSFVPLLEGGAQDGRDRIVTVYHETVLGTRYEMRCVQDRSVGYIWNAWSDGKAAYAAENMLGLTFAAMASVAETDPEVAARTELYRYRVPEELYDFEQDPDAQTNLVDDEAASELLVTKREQLGAWMREVDDPLAGTFDAAMSAGG